MKERRNILTISTTLLVSCLIWPICQAERDQEPCQFFSNGTKIRDPNDCSRGITCIDFNAVYTTKCSGSTPFYDKDKGSCVKSLTDDSLCSISCEDSSGKFVPDPKSCYGYYYCQDEDWARYGLCPDGTHFDYETQQCIYSTTSNCTVNTLNFCAIVKNGVNFNDPSSCEKYYTCKSGNLTSVSCKNQYFEPSSGKCVQKSLVNCKAHPYPTNVCGTNKSPKAGVFVKDGATCRGAFFCKAVQSGADKSPAWSQCPADTFFSEKEQRCVSPLLVACDEDRCDGRTLTFVSSGTKGCRYYLRCSNGVKVEQLTCGNKFFDEEAGVCTSAIIQYPSCAK